MSRCVAYATLDGNQASSGSPAPVWANVPRTRGNLVDVIFYDFLCDNCGYSEFVAGGRDAVLSCDSETRTCRDCSRLVDVVVHVRDWDDVEDSMRSSSDYAELAAKPLGVCPHCGGSNLSPWGEGSTLVRGGILGRVRSWGPCPRCDSPIRTTTNWYRTS